jgi:molecular chaperone Hsp33
MLADRLIRFYFPQLGVRAAWVRLEHAHERLHALSNAPPLATLWLTQSACAAALLTSAIKLNGKLSIQVQSPAALRMLFAECSDQGYLRGIARVAANAVFPSAERAGADASNTDFSSAFALATARGSLAITIEPEHGERYKGIVRLAPEGLSRTFEQYFENSEQLPTRMLLANGEGSSTGLMLQRVAQSGGAGTQTLDVDGWNRIEQLMDTLKADELAQLDEDTLMRRLFHEETVVRLAEQALTHFCPCSAERVGVMLQSIGRVEALAAADDAGFAGIQCEFCNADYRFDRVDIERLFHSAVADSATLQ